jgi:excisionase family DNA binding protein
MSRTQAPKRSTDTGRRLASLEEAAAYARCSKWTIRRRISEGVLTGYSLGQRLIRVDLNELDSVLAVIPAGGDAA